VPSVCVLAGGKGRRMGGGKCQALVAGRRLIDRAIETAKRTGLEVFVTGREELRVEGAEFLRDTRGEGPIAGLYSCLVRSKRTILLPCDMPLLTPEFLRFLLEESEGYDVLLCEVGGRLQPQVGVYTRRCLPAIERNIARGRFSLLSILEEGGLKVRVLGEGEVAKFGEPRRLFLNLNTREDLKLAEELLGWGPSTT